jgi:hypothetical protein
MILRVDNRSTRRKMCPSSALPTTNLTWTNLISNQGLHGEGPAANRLIQAFFLFCFGSSRMPRYFSPPARISQRTQPCKYGCHGRHDVSHPVTPKVMNLVDR